MAAATVKRPKPPISISRLADVSGLTRAEVTAILHEHDVPFRVLLQGRFLAIEPEDVDAIMPVLERTFANKIRRTEIVSRYA